MHSMHNCLSASSFSNPSNVGNVTGVTLTRYDQFGILTTWGFEPEYNPDTHPAEYTAVSNQTSFGIYLNGRLQQIQPGSQRSATVIAGDSNTQEIEVIAWPSSVPMPDTMYASIGTRRAHLDWDPVTATDLAGYIIYHSTSPAPDTEYATQDTVAVDGANFDFTSGASAIISGAPADSAYSNCTFTITITDGTTGAAELANSVNATVTPFVYSLGQPVVVMDGIVIVITEAPVTDDELDFPVQILTWYDTAPLTEGTHYFRIAAVDKVGNVSTPTADIPVAITPPPAPVQEWACAYDPDTDAINYAVTQSPDGTSVNVYSNYDTTTDTLMDEVYYIAPIATITVAAGIDTTGALLTGMAGRATGDYIFAARAVSAAGVESDDTTTDTVTMPYTANEPTILSATVTQTGSTYTLSWVADGASNPWNITAGVLTLTLTLDATTDDIYYHYSTELSVPGDGEYTITIYAGTYGLPYTITYTFDTTAPGTPGNATGTAY